MRILITGANGYIGKTLYFRLKKMYEIHILTRDICDLLNAEAVDEFFKRKYYDVIIHCAIVGGSRLVEDDLAVYDANMCMFSNILKNRNAYNKLINIGSGAEIYYSNTPYGRSKKDISNIIEDLSNHYNLRIFGIFDENEKETRFINSNINNILNDKNMVIHKDKYMDFFYMEDFITHIHNYINDDTSLKVLDCCYETKYKLSDICNIINKIAHTNTPINIIDTDIGESYIGNYTNLPIGLIGLELAIENTYNKIKCSKQ